MDCREQRSHARGVYPTQSILRMGTARVEEEADTRIIVTGRMERGHEGENALSSPPPPPPPNKT